MNHQNRRSNFRVELLLPVKWNILNEEEIEFVKKGLGNKLFKQEGLPSPIDEFLDQASPGSPEEQMYRSFQLLNNKLDFIIDQLISKSDDAGPGQDDLIELSASGLKFCTRTKISTGSFLKMSLIIPGAFQYRIELIAEVLRVKEQDNRFIIAAKIIFIEDDDRDSIVKMVFQKQRMDIRKIKAVKENNQID